jgi:hypothetical protein
MSHLRTWRVVQNLKIKTRNIKVKLISNCNFSNRVLSPRKIVVLYCKTMGTTTCWIYCRNDIQIIQNIKIKTNIKKEINSFRIRRPVENPEWFHPADTHVTMWFSRNLTNFGCGTLSKFPWPNWPCVPLPQVNTSPAPEKCWVNCKLIFGNRVKLW